MTLSEFLSSEICSGKVTVIIGRPGSGKTTVGELLAEQNQECRLWHTDDYIPYGGVEGLYQMMQEMEEAGYRSPAIIEGVGCYRLLRKGAELGVFYPDVVIELVVSDEQVERVYTTERSPEKLKKMPGFVKGLDTVLAGYHSIMVDRVCEGVLAPVWLTVENKF